MSTKDTTAEIEVKEQNCPACGWTEPIYQEGDPAICSCCGVEYPFGSGRRVRDWPRCGSYDTADGSPCERKVGSEDETCATHTGDSEE